jgi:hypothetical protein
MAKEKTESLIPIERITNRIYLIGGRKVMFDFDLAELYGVPTKALNQAVTRNAERFPEDFMFRLSPEEAEALNRSQSVTGSQKHRDPVFATRIHARRGRYALQCSTQQARR